MGSIIDLPFCFPKWSKWTGKASEEYHVWHLHENSALDKMTGCRRTGAFWTTEGKPLDQLLYLEKLYIFWCTDYKLWKEEAFFQSESNFSETN